MEGQPHEHDVRTSGVAVTSADRFDVRPTRPGWGARCAVCGLWLTKWDMNPDAARAVALTTEHDCGVPDVKVDPGPKLTTSEGLMLSDLARIADRLRLGARSGKGVYPWVGQDTMTTTPSGAKTLDRLVHKGYLTTYATRGLSGDLRRHYWPTAQGWGVTPFYTDEAVGHRRPGA